jgi:hypothetical protein
MVLPPLFQQHLDVRLNEADRRHDISVSHSPDRPDTKRLVAVWKADHDHAAALSNMHVRRAMLARREQNAHLEPADVQNGRHWMITYQLGYYHVLHVTVA